ncbi:hypothetical protein QCA50_007439 [Cerrena zonata]|uniref:JmjC domain-containing protein n=1 Tax=Cerrena zonata TaxID=2478898 RepID=A0AAW0G8H5_9APHY
MHHRGTPSYKEFYLEFLCPNVPVLLNQSLTASWPARHNWTKHCAASKSAEVCWEYLIEQYGDLEVTVADCAKSDSFGNQARCAIPFRDVVQLWNTSEGKSLYVKDWHLAKQIELRLHNSASATHTSFYTTPDIFRDDWMNAYYTAHTEDDFRFVYIGAEGTFTPLHRDVYTSYSWSTNIIGRKRWWLFPPDQTRYLFMKHRKMSVYDVRNVDTKDFPEFHLARPIVVEQDEGETIFVPSGWYHQVENITHCISINHNWCNSVNLHSLYHSMCEKVVEVKEALQDVLEMLSHNQSDDEWKAEWTKIVQDVVKHDAGWNFLTFWRMVLYALRNVASPVPDLSTSKSVFPHAPPNLRPPIQFVTEQIRMCYDDFRLRDRRECEGEVLEVVTEIGAILTSLQLS